MCVAAAAMEEEESGWKYIHGDVFRFPPSKSLFCSFVGTGTQVRVWALQITPPVTRVTLRHSMVVAACQANHPLKTAALPPYNSAETVQKTGKKRHHGFHNKLQTS